MEKPTKLPPQEQNRQPGIESQMNPRPEADNTKYPGCGRLVGKVALITGGDSGIGRAVAILFAKEGCNIAISYFDEHDDANETKIVIERYGRECVSTAGDISDEKFCQDMVKEVVQRFGKLDILINNAAIHYPQDSLEKISAEQLEKTFRTNIFPYFYLSKAALPHLSSGSCIINTTSVVAYKGNPKLIDYAATKGAIVSFTRSLALAVAERGIRVNAVAPGPIWTPLIPASFKSEEVAEFGQDVPLKRPGQPDEVAPCYLFLATEDSAYMTGQVLHPNGGVIVNG